MSKRKFNPFEPNKVVHSGMFVGRIGEIEAIEDALYQARHGNPQHFLVHGERGIGKSSLLFYVDVLARGQIVAGEETDETFDFLTVSLDLGSCSTQLDLIRKFGRAFRAELDRREDIKKKAKAVYEWLTDWEVLGVRKHKTGTAIDIEERSEELVTKIAEFIGSVEDEIDGVVFLIDEADRPPVEAGLGEFLKLFTERLNRVGCDRVLIGIAGLSGVLEKLRDSHPSSPRLFSTMLLEPLEVNERKQIIEIGMRISSEKTGRNISINDDALSLLAELSEGYPHFVQQFSHSAFSVSKNDTITEADVYRGAFGENGAISQLGDKFFSEMYHAKINSEDYRRVLQAMAKHGDSWISRKNIRKEAGVAEHTINNALISLKGKEIILQDGSRQGFYRLPTRSFAAWINAIQTGELAQVDTSSASSEPN